MIVQELVRFCNLAFILLWKILSKGVSGFEV